jgi:hypothetical protein
MKDKIVFDSIQEIKGRPNRKMRPSRLEKLDDYADMSADREDFVGSREYEITAYNEDMGATSMKKRTLPSIMKKQDENSRTKQFNLRYNNVSIEEDDDRPRTIAENTDFSKKIVKSKVLESNKIADQVYKRETVGSASFITPNPNDTANIETIIQKKS